MKTICILSTLLLSLSALAGADSREAPARKDREWTTTSTHNRGNGTTTVRRRGDGLEMVTKHTVSGPKGKSGTATTTGELHKTENGWSGSSKTVGECPNGKTWTLGRNTEAKRNDDGTVTVNRSASGTMPNGESVSRSSTATVTKTDAGRSWTVEGKTVTAKGCGSWTGQGSSTRTDEGRTWESSREGITPGGKTWSGQGSLMRTGAGGTWESSNKGQADGRSWTLESKGEFVRPNMGK